MKLSKAVRTCFAAIILSLLMFTPALTLLSPTATYSVQENRRLAQKPVFSLSALWDGSYFSGWETWFSDHIAGRGQLLRAHTALELLRGRACVNGVAVADTVLLPGNEGWGSMDRDFDAEAAAMASSLAPLAQQVQRYGGSFLYVGVPEQRSVFRNRYPAGVRSCSDYLDAIRTSFAAAMEEAGVPLLLLNDLYEEQDGLTDLYSATDHHYTIPGAYRTYQAICTALRAEGWTFPEVTDEHIRFTQLERPFLGTYSRKLYGLSPVSGSAWTYETDLTVPFTRKDNGQEVAAQVFSLPEDPKEAVSYTLYMGGDIAETVIDTGRDDLPSILIVGDSFTNALESIAYLSFGQMRSLDFRYYTEMTLSDYIALHQPDIVLIVRDDTSFLYAEGNGALQ